MSLVFIEPAKISDLNYIMTIINSSKQFLKEAGSNQWQNGYPDENIIKEDINNGHGWILKVNGKTAGYAACIIGKDPTYANIEDGEWANDEDPYATIHRLAISGDYRGQHLSSQLMSNLISAMRVKGIENYRIDTAPINKIVQKLATSSGFKYRGIIEVDNEPIDPERVAYELNLIDYE